MPLRALGTRDLNVFERLRLVQSACHKTFNIRYVDPLPWLACELHMGLQNPGPGGSLIEGLKSPY